jgi:hypothetical protein
LAVGRRGDTEKGLLRQAAQHRLCLWDYRQHRLQQEPSSGPIADRAKTSHPGVRGQVNLRRVLHQQDHRFRSHIQARLLPMRVPQRCTGHRWFIEQSVHGFQVFPGAVLLGQRGRRITDHSTGGLDGAAGAPLISQRCLAKGLLCSLVGAEQLRRFHQPLRFTPSVAKCG